MSQDPDSLTASSRIFYERSKAKLSVSIVLSALGLMLLGFCSIAGGNASYNQVLKDNALTSDEKSAYNALVSGYGFASFVYILAFLLLTYAGVTVSPLICGTMKEKNMIKTPSENFSYASYDDGKQI